MKSEEARMILGACPPGEWPDDPAVREALATTERDSQLAEWLRTERTFDAAIGRKLNTVAPPAKLKTAILAGYKATQMLEVERQRLQQDAKRWGVGGDSSRSGFRISPLAWAAIFLILAGVGSFWMVGPTQDPAESSRRVSSTSGISTEASPLAKLKDEAAQYLSSEWDHTLDYSQREFPKIQEWLSQQPNRIELQVPAGLNSARTYGCKVFRQNGQTRTLVCFLPGAVSNVVHVVSVDRDDLPRESTETLKESGLQLANSGEWNTATWADQKRVYVAYSHAAPELLALWVKP